MFPPPGLDRVRLESSTSTMDGLLNQSVQDFDESVQDFDESVQDFDDSEQARKRDVWLLLLSFTTLSWPGRLIYIKGEGKMYVSCKRLFVIEEAWILASEWIKVSKDEGAKKLFVTDRI